MEDPIGYFRNSWPSLRVAFTLAMLAALVVAMSVASALNPAIAGAQTSMNANLSALTLSPKDIIGFTANTTTHEVGVASTVTQATITATADHSAATVAFSGTDADSADGHQVNLSAGRNTVTITVTSEDLSTKAYRVRVNRGVTTDYGWSARTT